MNEVRMLIIISWLAVSLELGTTVSQIVPHQTGFAETDTTFWQKIGETTIDFHDIYNEILISRSEKYDSIKFSVTEPLTITDIVISFETGNNQIVKTMLVIDVISLPIELHSGERKLSKISFSYINVTEKEKTASVQLWGIKNRE
jgi:hypothetical protein